MPTIARLSSVTDERNNDGLINLIQCTGTGPDGEDCVAWTSIWLPKLITGNFMDRSFFCGFCAASGFEECKKSPPSNISDITSLLCGFECGPYDNIRIFGVVQIEDVYDRVVEVANDIGVTIYKQDISVSSATLQNTTITSIKCTFCPK